MESFYSLKEGYSPLVIRKPSESLKVESAKDTPTPGKKFNLKTPIMTAIFLTPTTVFATVADNTFLSVYEAIMNILDHVVVVAIIFAGASWMFGHRTKAIENLIGAAIGYIIATHAIDIREFLKGL